MTLPSLSFQDVQDTKADSDVVSSPVTDNIKSDCASTSDKDKNISPYISTQSSEEETKFFTCSLPYQPSFFFIECKDLQELRQHSISMTFCKTGLEDLLQKYFLLITGQHPTEKN
ncbi:hypothetical protein QQF64_025565 [Cirrhinus molitorella]|uniref:Uncharacterized protein n=1 Tax=Cirrhinus molitorella TaxID=172907 RepID=A0ABR3NQ91_9TELE